MTLLSRPVIEVENFTKCYGDLAAVRELGFCVHPGEIVGLVGANGAGKTTTLRAITGILRPTSGALRVGGHDIEQEPVAAKRLFAYIPDTVHPYDLLTVTEHLHFIALAYRIENAEAKYQALLDELELTDKKDEIASNLSRGMLQKLSLACAFLREPHVIILDEPLTGLDPRGIRNIKQSIRRRAAEGTAFLLSSHLLVLVEALCDEVLILHRGQKMAFGTLEEIRQLATLHEQASLEEVFFAVTERPGGPFVSGGAPDSSTAPRNGESQPGTACLAAHPGAATGPLTLPWGTTSTSGSKSSETARGSNGAGITAPDDDRAPAGSTDRLPPA